MDVHIENLNQEDYLFELGRSRSAAGNFLAASRMLESASSLYLSHKKYSKYMDCLNILFRMYKELQDVQKIAALKEELTGLVWEGSLKISPHLHYTLGQCALYMGDMDNAGESFEKSIHLAQDLKEKALKTGKQVQILSAQLEMCFSIYGMISFYIRKNHLNQAKKELSSLEKGLTAFKELEKEMGGTKSYKFKEIKSQITNFLSESRSKRDNLELFTELLKGEILRHEKKFHQLEQLFWNCYERVQKSKNLCMTACFFYHLGRNYMDMQDYTQARIFLNLAKKSIDRDNFKHLYHHVEDCLEKLETISSNRHDLVVHLSHRRVVEKQKGRVDFKNQFILLDLLQLFVSRQGMSYSKTQLVEKLWDEPYDPRRHDNKIYVTIKRLRSLVEPNSQTLKYILCGKDGYYLNSKVKVLIKEKQENSSQAAIS